MTTTSRRNRKARWVLVGIAITLFAGLFMVGVGLYLSRSIFPLWTLIYLGWSVERVAIVRKNTLIWHPILRGGMLAVFYVAVGVIALFFHTTLPIYCSVFINPFVDPICDQIERTFKGVEPQNVLEDHIDGM